MSASSLVCFILFFKPVFWHFLKGATWRQKYGVKGRASLVEDASVMFASCFIAALVLSEGLWKRRQSAGEVLHLCRLTKHYAAPIEVSLSIGGRKY